MNRKISAIIAASALTLALLMSACGKAPASESKAPAAESQTPATETKNTSKTEYPIIVKSGSSVAADLNGDGKNDEVSFEATEDGTSILHLSVNGADYAKSVYDQGFYSDNLEPAFFCITDIDTSDKTLEIAIMDYGPSSDYMTDFFRFDGNNLKFIGYIDGMITSSITDKSDLTFNGDGTINSYMRLGVLQTWWADVKWRLTDSGFKTVEQKLYYPVTPTEFGDVSNTSVTLKVDVIAYLENDLSSEKTVLPSGAELTFDATDNKEWVLAETSDGKQCWIHLDSEYGQSVETADGYVSSIDVFSGLLIAD